MKNWLIGGAAALGGVALIVDDLGSMIFGAIIGGGAVGVAAWRDKAKNKELAR